MQLKHTVVALAAAGMLSVQAHAGEMQVEAAIQPAQTVAAFTDADLQALFEELCIVLSVNSVLPAGRQDCRARCVGA